MMLLLLLLLVTASSASFDFSTCGTKKTCVGSQSCDSSACLAASFRIVDNERIEWEIVVNEKDEEDIVAIAISDDTELSDDFVVECSRFPEEPERTMKVSYNERAKSKHEKAKNVRIAREHALRPFLITDSVVSSTGGFLHCRATVAAHGIAGPRFYKLARGEVKYLVLATGRIDDNGFVAFSPTFTPRAEDFIKMENPIEAAANLCGTCAPGQVWFDLFFAVDTSSMMSAAKVEDVQNKIRDIVVQLVPHRYVVRFGIITYNDQAYVDYKLGGMVNSDAQSITLKYRPGKNGTNMDDAIVSALYECINNPNGMHARRVIVMISGGWRQGSYPFPTDMARVFRNQGGVIITVDYNYATNGAVDMLDYVASPGYKLTNGDALVKQIQDAFCDANCFCPSTFKTYYPDGSCNGRCPATNGCFQAVTTTPKTREDAETDCYTRGAIWCHLASIHSANEGQFAASQFPPMTKFWTGAHLVNATSGEWSWADRSAFDFTQWAKGQPVLSNECAYSQQYSGFSNGWFTENCNSTLAYSCKSRPCAADNTSCKLN